MVPEAKHDAEQCGGAEQCGATVTQQSPSSHLATRCRTVRLPMCASKYSGVVREREYGGDGESDGLQTER